MARAAIFPSVSNLNFRELHIATSTVEDTIAWLPQHGLLATDRPCTVCGNSATRFETAKGRTDVGGGARIVIARGMCLSGMGAFLDLTASLELKQVLDFLHLYTYEHASTAPLMSECRMASEAILN